MRQKKSHFFTPKISTLIFDNISVFITFFKSQNYTQRGHLHQLHWKKYQITYSIENFLQILKNMRSNKYNNNNFSRNINFSWFFGEKN